MTDPNKRPLAYRALREASGISQRGVERQLGWRTGRLSVIERGLIPTREEHEQLMAFFVSHAPEAVVTDE